MNALDHLDQAAERTHSASLDLAAAAEELERVCRATGGPPVGVTLRRVRRVADEASVTEALIAADRAILSGAPSARES